MIFVTVGMHDKGFDRLLQAMDSFAGNHPDQKVVMQTGSSRYHPNHTEWFSFKPDIEAELERADLIVSHGGVSILHYYNLGKRLLVVPRDPLRGELFDDHQAVFMEQVQKRFKIPVLRELTALDSALLSLLQSDAPPKRKAGETGLHKVLKAYLSELESGSHGT